LWGKRNGQLTTGEADAMEILGERVLWGKRNSQLTTDETDVMKILENGRLSPHSLALN
jgi:hypothetical protein